MSYRVAVRALCEFTAKRGDLDLRFTPSPTALEGIAGHQEVAGRRGAGYQTEVPLSGDHRNLRVSGRADGYSAVLGQVDEVKTYRGDLDLMPDNHRDLHWAQVRIYGHLICQRDELSEIRVALVYFNVVTQKERVLVDVVTADELRTDFEQQCDLFIDWAEQELAHRRGRDRVLAALSFPHTDFRTGQRPLAETVYKTAAVGSALMAQAPTGIGKTIGTLFPLLKAMPGQGLDKVFFLTAKTPGRRLALDAARRLNEQADPEPIRVLELIARDKACEHPDKACHGDSCPLARGFYDRLPAARQAAASVGWLDQPALREIARAHEVCPYYLSQEMARWSDLVVSDYNYYFDLSAMLYALSQANDWRVAVLADEAHNLVERARSMYSAELDQRHLRGIRRTAPQALKKTLNSLHRHWNELSDSSDEGALYQEYEVLPVVPSRFLGSLQRTVAALTDYFTEHPFAIDSDLQRLYFDLVHFGRMADAFGDHSLFDLTRPRQRGDRPSRGRPATILCLRNVVPAPFLKERFEAAHTSILFSATLSPRRYYSDLLGLPDRTGWLDVESPFQTRQLQVRIARDVSTRYPDRAASLAPLCDIMARQYRHRPGNYLAFFSSYHYLEQVADRFNEQHPDIPTVRQHRHMDEPSRQAFLDRLVPGGQGIAFAVLGGAFAEGIDLPGNRLIGAFIATLGLPQVNPVNEQIKQRMQTIFGAGYDYTYFYPGIQKVVQAAGRVIRTQDDEGVVWLMDDRFGWGKVRRLMPGWWARH